METETVKSGQLIGTRMRVVVERDPCRVHMQGCMPLTETTEGVIETFFKMPGGAVGVIKRDDGVLVAFDAELDIKAGKVWLESIDDDRPSHPHPAQ